MLLIFVVCFVASLLGVVVPDIVKAQWEKRRIEKMLRDLPREDWGLD